MCLHKTRRFVPAGLYVYMQEKIKKYLDWKGTYAPRASVNYRIWLERFVQISGEKPLEAYEIRDYIKFKQWVQTHYSPYSGQIAAIAIKNFFQFYRDQNFQCLSATLIKVSIILKLNHIELLQKKNLIKLFLIS